MQQLESTQRRGARGGDALPRRRSGDPRRARGRALRRQGCARALPEGARRGAPAGAHAATPHGRRVAGAGRAARRRPEGRDRAARCRGAELAGSCSGCASIGLIAPPSSAGIIARIRGILIVLAAIVAILALGFGIVEGIGQLPFGGISARPRDLLRRRARLWSPSATRHLLRSQTVRRPRSPSAARHRRPLRRTLSRLVCAGAADVRALLAGHA